MWTVRKNLVQDKCFLGSDYSWDSSLEFLSGKKMDNTTFAAVTHGLGSHCRNLVSAHQTEEGSQRSLRTFFLSSHPLVFPILSRTSNFLSWKHPRAQLLLTKKTPIRGKGSTHNKTKTSCSLPLPRLHISTKYRRKWASLVSNILAVKNLEGAKNPPSTRKNQSR